MGYRIWLPQQKKVIHSQYIVFNEASLLKRMIVPLKCDNKRAKFQHVQPRVKSDMNPGDAPDLTE